MLGDGARASELTSASFSLSSSLCCAAARTRARGPRFGERCVLACARYAAPACPASEATDASESSGLPIQGGSHSHTHNPDVAPCLCGAETSTAYLGPRIVPHALGSAVVVRAHRRTVRQRAATPVVETISITVTVIARATEAVPSIAAITAAVARTAAATKSATTTTTSAKSTAATAAESAIAARSTRQVYHHLLLRLARLASQAPAQSLRFPVRHGAPALYIHENTTSANVHAFRTRIGRPHISLTIK